jgi:hypothetical protein
MIPEELEAISKHDIDALTRNAVSESRTLEYKEKLPGAATRHFRIAHPAQAVPKLLSGELRVPVKLASLDL